MMNRELATLHKYFTAYANSFTLGSCIIQRQMYHTISGLKLLADSSTLQTMLRLQY